MFFVFEKGEGDRPTPPTTPKKKRIKCKYLIFPSWLLFCLNVFTWSNEWFLRRWYFEQNLLRNRPHSQLRADQDEMWRPLFWWHPSNTFRKKNLKHLEHFSRISKKTSKTSWTFFNIRNIFNIAQIPGVRSSVNIHNACSFGRHPKYEVVVLIVVAILAAVLPESVHLGGIFWRFLISLLLGSQNILEILPLPNYQWPLTKIRGSLTIFMSASSLDQSRFRLTPGRNSPEFLILNQS